MKRAIVLSGGGAKGGYHIGAWKAFRRLGINFDIVTGTSVGALIGALMVQYDYHKAFKLWHNMDYKKVIDVEIKGKYSTPLGKQEIIKKYAKGAIKGGLEMVGLKEVIDNGYDEEKFYSSNVDFGLVTTYFPSLKPKYVTKSNVKKEEIKDYLIASASCFPAFKMKKINNDLYIDGGYCDNLPINLAIELGADEVVAIELGAVGIIKKIENTNVPVKIIKPRNDLGSFLAFEKTYARYAMDLGYNDVMKEYGMLDGNKYTFKLGSLNRNYDRISSRFYKIYDSYINNSIISSKVRKITDKNKKKELNNAMELLAESFNINPSKIYRTSLFNILIKKEFIKSEIKSFNTIKAAIKNNSLKKMFVSKELICYIYNELNKDNKKHARNLMIMFPSAFLCAIYLKTILRR